MPNTRKSTVLFYDRQLVTFHAENNVHFFNDPVGSLTTDRKRRLYADTNMHHANQFHNDFELTELRVIWRLSNGGMPMDMVDSAVVMRLAQIMESALVRVCVGSWCPIDIPLVYLDKPFRFDIPLFLARKQNFSVDLITSVTDGFIVATFDVGLKGTYHYPVQ